MYEYALLATGIGFLIAASLKEDMSPLSKNGREILATAGGITLAVSLLFYLGSVMRISHINGSALELERKLLIAERNASQYQKYIDAMENLTNALLPSDNTVYIDKSIIGGGE